MCLCNIPLHFILSFTAWFFYAITLSGLLYLKIKKPELDRSYRVGVTRIHIKITKTYFILSTYAPLFFSPQVPFILPVLVLIASIFLVLAPIIDKPQIEFLYVTLFVLSGAILYVPFIHFKLCPGLLTKLTVYLQLLLEVAPAEKNL